MNVTEIGQYHALGYLIPGFRLPAARIDHLRATLDQLIRDNPGVRPEKLVSAHVVGQGSTGKNDEGVKGNQDFLDLAMEPDILDMVNGFLGRTSSCGVATCFANQPVTAMSRRGTKTGIIGRCAPLVACRTQEFKKLSTFESA